MADGSGSSLSIDSLKDSILCFSKEVLLRSQMYCGATSSEKILLTDLRSIIRSILNDIDILDQDETDVIRVDSNVSLIKMSVKLSTNDQHLYHCLVDPNTSMVWVKTSNEERETYQVIGSVLPRYNIIRRLTTSQRSTCKSMGWIIDDDLFPSDEVKRSMIEHPRASTIGAIRQLIV